MNSMERMNQYRLPALAGRINAEHEAATADARHGLPHALEAGYLLAQAKDMCGDGQWQKWLEDNFRGSIRVAQVYLSLHAHRDKCGSNAVATATLTCEGALASIAEQHPDLLPDYIPKPGFAAHANADGKLAYIHPHTRAGYFFCGVADVEAGTVEYVRHGIHAGGVPHVLERLGFDADAAGWVTQPADAWEYDHIAYDTAESAAAAALERDSACPYPSGEGQGIQASVA